MYIFCATCDVRQPEALASERVVRVEFNPHVVLRGDVRSRDGRTACSVTVQVLVGANGDPVQTAAMRALDLKVLKTGEGGKQLINQMN